ncbi:mitochondrial inner membrane protein OXA1-like [Rutidosis leptorrhynchoides]|uniref:mitochondrial inner membrane protein OXA1-like n=1 Tax=Rutidosis leptorrhynchoides TaxID=125765 RepID=UPI003A98F7C0
MAFRRSLTTRAKVFAQQQFTPSISYVNHHDDRKNQHSNVKSNNFLQNRLYGVLPNYTNTLRINCAGSNCASFKNPKWSQIYHQAPTITSGFLLARNISSQASSVVNEVSAAMADCSLPVAAMECALDVIHNFTGLHWWASIIIASAIIQILKLPLSMYTIASVEKFKPSKLDITEGQFFKKLQRLEMSHPFLSRLYLSLSSYQEYSLAVSNPSLATRRFEPKTYCKDIADMVQKVPSFKTGGAFWFVDLTTPDLFYFPCWLCLALYIRVDALTKTSGFHDREKIINKISPCLVSLLLVPFLPKAFYLYLITSNLINSTILKKFKKTEHAEVGAALDQSITCSSPLS